jgi:hypothetical protein
VGDDDRRIPARYSDEVARWYEAQARWLSGHAYLPTCRPAPFHRRQPEPQYRNQAAEPDPERQAAEPDPERQAAEPDPERQALSAVALERAVRIIEGLPAGRRETR